MKTLILALALVAKADAPKAELHEVAAASAAVASVQIMPEAFAVRPAKSAPCGLNRAAVGIAAVAPEPILPEAGRGRIAVADAPLLGEARASVAAKSGECLVSEVGTGEPCALRASVSLKTITAAPVSEPRRLAPLPEPKTGTGCDLVSLFETRRFLSAPWSASRRLKAARLRGDEDEARRMEARLGELVEEALGIEDEGADDD